MKKSLMMLGAAMMAAMAFAGADNVIISFATPSPDKYADGTQVADGEVYALIWTAAGKEFAGVNGDGTLVGTDSKIVVKAPVAKDGKCPQILFRIDEDYVKANYPGGTWGVYLLDTRTFVVDEDGVIAKDGEGKPAVKSVNGGAVKGWGKVGDSVSGSATASISVAAGASAGTASAANIKIERIAFDVDNVLLYVSGADAGIYQLSSGDAPGALAADGKDRSGDGSGEAIIIRPKKAGGEFFQVNRK